MAVATALAAGLAPAAMVAAQAESAWPTIDGDGQHSRQGVARGPVTPAVAWTWEDPTYVADGSIGGTRTNIPGVLDGSGRLLFKARNTEFDDRDGVTARYDLLALDPATGEAEIVLTDVQKDYCVPAVGPDGTIWTLQDINERTEPATDTNPAHGERGHEHQTHHPESSSWVVGIDPATDSVVHRYSGEGVHPPDHSAIGGECDGSLNVAADGTMIFLDVRGDLSPGGFDQWLRAINPDGTSKWEINVEQLYAEPRNWGTRSGTRWQLIAPQSTPGAGTLYLGYTQVHPDGDGKNPGLAAFDLESGALRATIDLPGRNLNATPVIDPDGGIVVSVDDPEVGGSASGHVLRVTDDGNALSIDWHQQIVADRDRVDGLRYIPSSLQVSGDRIVGIQNDTLVSFAWSDGAFDWRTRIGLDTTTDKVLVDGDGNIFVGISGGDHRLKVYSSSGQLIGFTPEDSTEGLRTIGPLAADGTLYVWGGDNTWWALEHDPEGVVPCPEGTSETVTCTKNPAGGYVMRGTGEDETFVGSSRPDKLVGRGGDDVLRGKGRADLLRGNGGSDRVVGGGGADTLVGSGGEDRLDGGRGRDAFRAGGGRDVIKSSGQRRESVNCGRGRDKVRGARGDRVARNCERVRR